MTTNTYTSIVDVINYVVEPALGDFAADYDMQGIAHDIMEWSDEEGAYVVDEDRDDFYEIAENHSYGLGLQKITTPSGMLDSYRAKDGWSIVPEEFENHSYGLVIKVDGEEARLNLYTDSLKEARVRAKEWAQKFAAGWRPINWARNRADAKYRKANVTRFEVKLYPADSDIAQHLEDLTEPRATYIKRLIREDMERNA
jgi:hypothetical protein